MSRISSDLFKSRYLKCLVNSAVDSATDNLLIQQENYDISVDDLIVRESDDTIRLEVESLCKEWQQLDNKFLYDVKDRVLYQAPKGYLAIPQGISLTSAGDASNATLSHARIPEGNKEEYVTAFRSLLSRIPRARALKNNFEKTKPFHLQKLKNILNNTTVLKDKSESYVDDLKAIETPLLYVPVISKKQNEEVVNIPSSETVLSFSVHSSLKYFHNKAPKEQDVDILGSQSLKNLKDVLYCARKKDYNYANIVESNGENRRDKKEDAFFFIEGVFYVDDSDDNNDDNANVSDDNINEANRNGISSSSRIKKNNQVEGIRNWMLASPSMTGNEASEEEKDMRERPVESMIHSLPATADSEITSTNKVSSKSSGKHKGPSDKKGVKRGAKNLGKRGIQKWTKRIDSNSNSGIQNNWTDVISSSNTGNGSNNIGKNDGIIDDNEIDKDDNHSGSINVISSNTYEIINNKDANSLSSDVSINDHSSNNEDIVFRSNAIANDHNKSSISSSNNSVDNVSSSTNESVSYKNTNVNNNDNNSNKVVIASSFNGDISTNRRSSRISSSSYCKTDFFITTNNNSKTNKKSKTNDNFENGTDNNNDTNDDDDDDDDNTEDDNDDDKDNDKGIANSITGRKRGRPMTKGTPSWKGRIPKRPFSLLEAHGISSGSTLQIKSMRTIISTLHFRPGVRYLFRHTPDSECDCEHFLYFIDMHLHDDGITSSENSYVNNSGSNSNRNNNNARKKYSSSSDKNQLIIPHRDLANALSYPRNTYLPRVVTKKCSVCLVWSAQYEVHGDRLGDRNPMHYCQHCYFMLHHSPMGELIYDDFVTKIFNNDEI